MRIDDEVERLVRENLGAVILGDPGRAAAATRAIVDHGDQVFEDALALCFAVDEQLLRDLHDGPARADSIAWMAESAARMEVWADLNQADAWRFLMALVQSRDPWDVLPAAEAVRTGFVVGAWLLAAFTPEGQRWEEVLDEALDALENKVLQGSFTS
jgi:hypothetical protein